MSESIGAINIPRMIWTSTLLTLGSLFICWWNTPVQHPTILQSAMQYPYTIIFRVGMMYSLFITFLELLFIKWWIDSIQKKNHTKWMVGLGTVGLAAYGLFVSCIDRKRINYILAENCVFVAALATSYSVWAIMKDLKSNRQELKSNSDSLQLANETSWTLKRVFSFAHFVGLIMGGLIYFGQLDISWKASVEYLMVISTQLFFWSFTIDFNKCKMDVAHIAA